ncbi:unknown protein [Microcystis aeruginosa NIES-843]|uniref:Uncharacterized protein n=1 Tax=Microcystis aeruginosa (strain NIES-843 / IAM M-2473) TaxID=449447 RepID=B0JXH6_MICAN|nr:unknown protein [Microcystis aeruginosa NIES-843]
MSVKIKLIGGTLLVSQISSRWQKRQRLRTTVIITIVVGWVDPRKPNKKQWEEGNSERSFRQI